MNASPASRGSAGPRSGKDRLILALDVPTRAAALGLVAQVGGEVGRVKGGLELFTAEGPALVRELRAAGAEVFLDLKLHDIPNTVAGAVRSAAGRHSPWLIASIISISAFMEVLDTAIANVSLRHIAGSMAASYDEATWVLTSYLISSGIFMPLTGYLTDRFGQKTYLIVSIIGFTIASMLCGLSVSLNEVLLFRLAQGVAGAGLVAYGLGRWSFDLSVEGTQTMAFVAMTLGQTLAVFTARTERGSGFKGAASNPWLRAARADRHLHRALLRRHPVGVDHRALRGRLDRPAERQPLRHHLSLRGRRAAAAARAGWCRGS